MRPKPDLKTRSESMNQKGEAKLLEGGYLPRLLELKRNVMDGHGDFDERRGGREEHDSSKKVADYAKHGTHVGAT
jgi:hypothetical protein